jgi:hypothetical protein
MEGVVYRGVRNVTTKSRPVSTPGAPGPPAWGDEPPHPTEHEARIAAERMTKACWSFMFPRSSRLAMEVVPSGSSPVVQVRQSQGE